MTGLPIPQDWDGEEWFCVSIQWPSSVLWAGILAGLLTTMERGRTWDGGTGSILDVQAIGREIHDRNLPFTLCDNVDTGGNDGNIDRILRYSGIADCCVDFEEIYQMSCSIPYGSLRWNNGVLQYLYCGEWHDVGGGAPVDAPVADYEPPELDAGGYSACGKAEAVMSMVLGVINSILDEVGNFSWQWWGHVKGDNPGVGMDAKWIITACVGAVNQATADAAAGEAYDPDALDASTWQSVKCALARQFSDTMPEPMDGNAIRSSLQTLFAREWGTDVLTNAIFVDALRGINAQSFTDAVVLGASYGDADCTCPDEFGIGYSGSVRFTGEIVASTHPEWITTHEVLNNGKILHIVWEAPEGVSKSDPDNVMGIEIDTPGVSSIHFLVYPASGSDVPKREYYTSTCYGEPGTTWVIPDMGTGWATIQGTETVGVMGVLATASSPPFVDSTIKLHMRKCDVSPQPAITYDFYVEIDGIDGNPV